MRRWGAGLAALLLAASVRAQCIQQPRKHVTVGYGISRSAVLGDVRQHQQELFARITEYWKDKQVDVRFKPGDGDYSIRFEPRHRLQDVLTGYGKKRLLGYADKPERRAFIYVYPEFTSANGMKRENFIALYKQDVAHELGHLWGLKHSKAPNNLLYEVNDHFPENLTCEQYYTIHQTLKHDLH